MDQNIVPEILHELFASLEALDTQTTAIRQFLKDKGIAPEQELAPYLAQAGNASSVRWLAARVRIDHLLSSAMKPAEQDTNPEPPPHPENTKQEEANAAAKNTGDKAGQKKEGEKKEDQKKEDQKEGAVSQETKKESPSTEPASANDKPRPQEVANNEEKVQKPEKNQQSGDKKNRNAA